MGALVPARSSASRLLGILGIALAPLACQQLGGTDPVGSESGFPEDDTGVDTFAPVDTDDEGDGGGLETGCNPVAQTGCNPGEKCTAVKVSGAEAFACVSDPGMLEPYASCSAALHDGRDGCSAGFVCLEGADEAGACVPLCLTNSDCNNGLCVYHSTDQVRHCADDCSPFSSDCTAPLQCRRASDRFVCKFPGDGDLGNQGSPCLIEEDVGCNIGFVCVPGPLVVGCTEPNCCTSLCDVSDADTCPGASTCNVLFSSPAPGYADVGACFVPA